MVCSIYNWKKQKTNTKLMAIMCPINAHFGTSEYTQEFNIEMWIFREWSWWFSKHCCTQRFYEPKQKKKSFDDNKNLNWERSKEAHKHKRTHSHSNKHAFVVNDREKEQRYVMSNAIKQNQIKLNHENVNVKTKTVNLMNIR